MQKEVLNIVNTLEQICDELEAQIQAEEEPIVFEEALYLISEIIENIKMETIFKMVKEDKNTYFISRVYEC